ncbi:hypothetical protein RQX57_004137 [Vibrio vulnificus]|nr:hypothetical protein [Vibrio vulnificus]
MSEILVELGKLTQASQEQTAASQAQTSEVAGKMGEIEAQRNQMQTDVDNFLKDRERIGDGSAGSRRLNVYVGKIQNGKTHIPETEKPVDWVEGNENLYLHFKTPFNTNDDDAMFHFIIEGYAYGSAEIISETFCGYCYRHQDSLIATAESGNHAPTAYKAPNGDIYLRLFAKNCYIWTFAIDAMHVAGGLPAEGSLELTISPNETLNNY